MTETLHRVPINHKEGEAIMWCLGQIVNWPEREPEGPYDPLFVLLARGFNRAAIMDTGCEMYSIAYDHQLAEPLTALEKAILKVCVENTTWIDVYRRGEPTADNPAAINEALRTLRELSVKLEGFGIEIDRIPYE